jgi:hypothetical protein
MYYANKYGLLTVAHPGQSEERPSEQLVVAHVNLRGALRKILKKSTE